MNEDILKSLIQLLVIVAKQDNVVSESERNYIINLLNQDLDPESVNSYIGYFDQLSGYTLTSGFTEQKEDTTKRLSVKETVQTLAICNKINKNLELKQKIFLLLKILQLIAVDQNFTNQKKLIIETISAVFNIHPQELEIIKSFVFHRPGHFIDFKEILLVNKDEHLENTSRTKHIHADIHGEITFLKLESVDMYFLKYYGEEIIILNGFIMIPGQVYIFSNGGTIKTQKGEVIYFSELIQYYHAQITSQKLSFNVTDVSFHFGREHIALRNIQLSEGPGKLIGIMGASGAGKTTLLNVLSGINKPDTGKIIINGEDLHSKSGKKKLKGMVGYVAQDDLLMEELSVFQNLYYNAKLCFDNLPEDAIFNKVDSTLKSLGLEDRKHIRVGSVFDKRLSGGQRKRLNIALELIREPSILFVDEPTSGLSSRDSENVMDLLKELTYKGKLIFVVIHQPSSDIYKLFDRIYILDTGGLPIYYGNPIDAVTHFKKATRQIDGDKGLCPTCGNVNPEQIFNIIEEHSVDEYGNLTDKRKISPTQWEALFKKSIQIKRVEDVHEVPTQNLYLPSPIRQLLIFLRRDFLKKISDHQYLIINLLESPLLAFILVLIVRYRNFDEDSTYFFRFNDNIPIFIMMSIIVALFFGLMVSAEEIIGDRKILKRESFLNLSRNSYLLSKCTLLFTLSGIQTLLFVIISHSWLEIRGMNFPFWFALFSVSCFANVLGLNISSALKSTVSVYILIPLLIIPQMVLSGLLVKFDKINELIGNKAKVPIIADLMVTRWAYEAMAVHQYINNEYEKPIYPYEKEEIQSDFKSTYYIEEMSTLMNELEITHRKVLNHPDEKIRNQSIKTINNNFSTIVNEIRHDPNHLVIHPGIIENLFTIKETGQDYIKYYDFLYHLKNHYRRLANEANSKKEKMLEIMENKYREKNTNIDEIKNLHYNESLADLVRNSNSIEKVTTYRNQILQYADPIYNSDLRPIGYLDYRSHFFSPVKHLGGNYFHTYPFNMAIIWILTLLLYILLYFDGLKKLISAFNRRR